MLINFYLITGLLIKIQGKTDCKNNSTLERKIFLKIIFFTQVNVNNLLIFKWLVKYLYYSNLMLKLQNNHCSNMIFTSIKLSLKKHISNSYKIIIFIIYQLQIKIFDFFVRICNVYKILLIIKVVNFNLIFL